MSLQLWLPLNGDLTNNGLMNADATSTRLTYAEDGKIGKCARFNNNTYIDLGLVSVGKEFSICGWFNIITHNVNWATCVELYYDDTNIIKFCSLYNTTQNFTSFNIMKNNVYIFDKYQFPFTLNQWNHFCVTVKDKKVAMYINGQISYQGDMTDTPLYGEYKLRIGNRFTGSYYPDFKLNDFRVYDHCLSPKEVKEISKGLMLHYPLSSPYDIGFANKYSGVIAEGKCISQSGFAVTKLSNERGYNYKLIYTGNGTSIWYTIRFPNFSFTADKTYQYSCKVRKNKLSNATLELRASRIANDWARKASFSMQYIPADGEWHTISIATVIPATFSDRTGSVENSVPCLEFYTGSNNVSGTLYEIDVDIKDVQVVECDGPVEFIENEFLDSTIYDTSGYKNNGAISEASKPVLGADSPRNRNSYYFKDLQRLELSNTAYENMSKGTISFWIKFNEKFLNWSHYLKIADGFNWTGRDIDFIIVANNATVTSAVTSTPINIATCSYITAFTASLNTWYHIAIEWDAENYIIKKYLNGSLLGTIDDSSYKRLDTYRNNHYYHHIGNATLNSTYNGNFNISDFRIYATCLSDSDIQELYNKPISIDNQGTMFAVEAAEETASPVKFNKTGVVEANQIGEYSHNYFDYNGSMNTGIQKNVDVEKLIENNGLKLTCNSAVTTHMILYRMQQLMFNGASGDFRVEFDGWATNPVDIRFDICDKTVATHSFNSTKQHFSGIAYSVNQYNTSSAYNGFFDIEASSIPLGTEIYITNIVITKNTPKSIGSNYIVIDDIIEN